MARAVLLVASLAVLVASVVCAVQEGEQVQGLQSEAVQDLEDDLMSMLKSSEERRAMQMAVPKDLSLGESVDETDDESQDRSSEPVVSLEASTEKQHVRDSTDEEFPSDSEGVSGDKRRAEQRLLEEDARFTKLNPKVRVVDDVGEEATADDCSDDPNWAKDCPHLKAHCGTSVVMKARCRKACGCGPKLDIYVPSLKDAPGAMPGNGTRLF